MAKSVVSSDGFQEKNQNQNNYRGIKLLEHTNTAESERCNIKILERK